MKKNTWWYRFLKVIYVAGGILTLIVGVAGIFEGSAPYSFVDLSGNLVTYGSWSEVIFYLIILFVSVYAAMYLTKSVFNYIVFGERFKVPPLPWELFKNQ